MTLFSTWGKYLTPARLASIVAGFLFFILVTQKYIHERFSLLERASVGLLFFIALIYFSKTRIKALYISIPAALLTIAMGISVLQMPATFIIRDYLAYVLIAVFSVVLVSAFGIGAARNGLIVGLVFLLSANVVVLFTSATPDFVGAYKFVGTSYGSNTLAASLVICVPAVLSVETKGKASRIIAKFLIFLVTAYFIFITGALTAMVTLLSVVVFWSLYLVAHKWRKSILWLWGISLLALSYISINVASLLAELGKSTSLSGRVPLWQAYLEKIWENPVIGYGWSFQTRTDMPLGLFIWQKMGVPLSNAHNDFLNWWAQTGLVGGLAYIVAIATIIVIGFKSRKVSNCALWLFFTGIAMAMNGVTELSSMYGDGWLVFMISSASIASILVEKHNQQTTHKYLVFPVNHFFSHHSLKR